jgi:hypothetical protein
LNSAMAFMRLPSIQVDPGGIPPRRCRPAGFCGLLPTQVRFRPSLG